MQALILAGGSGTRFWPLSRRRTPKQLLSLDGEETLLQRTAARLLPLVAPRDVWVCTTEALAEAVAAQLPAVPREQILAEPEGRNTAPAIAWAVASMPALRQREAVVVLPADHHVGDDAAFRAVVERAAVEADRGRVLALGVLPRWPETGYGYLELGGALGPRAGGLFAVQRFVEKPDRARAEAFVASGRYLWNAGIFAFRGDLLLELVEQHLPALAAGLAGIGVAPGRLAELYGSLPAISIDHGLMEKLDSIATLPLDCGWSDLGSWQALAEFLPGDEDGNTLRGEVVAVGCRNSLLWSEEGTLAVLGMDGVVAVRTRDAVLVMPKERAQEVRAIVDALRARGSEELPVTQEHLPRSSRFADRFHRWAFRHGFPFLGKVAPLWPRWFTRLHAGWIIGLVFAVYPAPKRLIRRNLSRILGLPAGSWRVRRAAAAMLRNFAIYHADLFRFSQLPAEAARACLDGIEGLEHLERPVEEGRGAVMLTAHFGNYELGGVLLGRRQLPVSIVYVKDKFEVAERFRSQARARGGIEEIPVEPRSSWSSLPVLRALRAGRLVAMQGDRDFDGKGIPASFFGIPVRIARGPFVVALLTGAPVVPTFINYTPSYRFVGRIYPPIEVKATGDRERDLGEAVARWAAVLEGEVRQNPTQWYTFYDYFADHGVEPAEQVPVPPIRRPARIAAPAGRASA